jgi:hypothetical protein
MASGPAVSGRKVRAAVGDTIATVNQHAKAFDVLDRAIGNIGRKCQEIEAQLPPTGLWARLKWLVRG